MTESIVKLKDIQNRKFVQVTPDTPLRDTVRQMDNDGLDTALVVREQSLLGVLSSRDVLRVIHQRVPLSTPVQDLMSSTLCIINHSVSIKDACEHLLEKAETDLIVIDDNGLALGLVGEHELLAHLDTSSREPVVGGGKRAQLSAESEQAGAHYQALIDGFPFLFWHKDTDGRFLTANQPFYIAMGLSSLEELIGKTDFDLCPRELAEGYQALDREVIFSRQNKQIEEQIEKNGQYTWFETVKTPAFKRDGNVSGTMGFARDITEQKKGGMLLRTLKRQTDLLSRFAAALINLPAESSDAVVNNALREMGDLIQVDRAYIFRYDFDVDTGSNTHEWCASGITPQIKNLQAIPLENVQDWVRTHKRGKSLVVKDVSALPPGMLKEILDAQDIKSLISLPLMGSDGCIGFLGFDAVRSKREYGPEVREVLELFARILANYRERQNAERQLANSEANFHAFFDHTQDFLFVLNHQGNVVHCNRHVTQRLGFSTDEMYGQPLLQLHPQASHDEATQIVTAMLEGKADFYSSTMQTRAGKLVPVEIRGAAGQWNDLPALFVGCRDLSDISASEEKFSKAFHLSPMPMAISDQHSGEILEINEAFIHVTGYSSEETIGNTAVTMGLYCNPDDKDYISKQLLKHGQAINIEIALRTKGGEIVYGLFNTALLELQCRQVVITQMQDITERKAMEEALANERLQLRSLIDTLPNLVWLKDPDGVYLACNFVFERLFGQPESGILGKTDADFVDKDQMEIFRENDLLAIQSGKPHVNEEVLTFVHDGYSGLFETTKTPMFDSKGTLIGVLGISRDITDARQAELERLRMEREIQQSRKMEALGQLTGGVAHEFNNMLAIILGHKELLHARLGPNIDSSLGTCLDHIGQAGDRAKELVQQLHNFSRPKEKKPKRINLGSAVHAAITLSRSSLPSSIEIDFRLGSQVPDVRLDIGELQQMLTNLLINARDAMGGKGRIELVLELTKHTKQECQLCHTRVEGEWVELRLQDNGPGIPPDQLSRIFEPFFTTKDVGEGTGLGLSLVRGIVEHNGGHILLDSRLGQGTRFRILFPPLAYKTYKPISKPVLLETPSLHPRKVLVVDDEPALTEFLQEALEINGLQVVACNDSREALAILLDSDQNFDLLITDQTMPGLLGTELAIKAKECNSHLKVILYTGHSEQINSSNATELGVDCFLEKPIGIHDVVVAIDELWLSSS